MLISDIVRQIIPDDNSISGARVYFPPAAIVQTPLGFLSGEQDDGLPIYFIIDSCLSTFRSGTGKPATLCFQEKNASSQDWEAWIFTQKMFFNHLKDCAEITRG